MSAGPAASSRRPAGRDNRYAAASLDDAMKRAGTSGDRQWPTGDCRSTHRGDRRGDRRAGRRHSHAWRRIEHGKHVVMVNVEADAVAGPLLAERAETGMVYWLA